ncbi:H-2 class II histocompatibility antigen gamma chain-like [Eucyclogobius newberryi]|uniref:H-2 class II histocompatibility antigen gamma chain-like n=1 Tax=Eucyclogobius newberryi TaxID=166745 RepID=UPI003B5CB907
MEYVSEDAPLAEGRAGSEQVLVEPTGPQGGSNSRALKIAGITTLVCLLVSAQVFTAYLVFDQRQQIQGLQMNNQKMERQMVQRRVMPQKMVMPVASMPLLDFSEDDVSIKSTPTAPPPTTDVAPLSLEKQLQGLLKDGELPEMNGSFLDNLQNLKLKVSETDWKSFESWMRHWLIFQMAQMTPSPKPDAGNK